MSFTDRFQVAIAGFDRANSEDPNRTLVRGVSRPKELAASERLSVWVERLDPEASEALRLAARCQHIRRWIIPRSDYPDGRIGYLEWRKALSKLHADVASEILKDAGYDHETTERVRSINLKRGLKHDRDVQTMEDALCLSFLEHEAEDFAEKHAPEKVIEILRKTWKKMSPRGQREAAELALPEGVADLLKRATER